MLAETIPARMDASAAVRLWRTAIHGAHEGGALLRLGTEATSARGLLLGLEQLDELRHDLVDVADDSEIGDREDRGLAVLVDRDDVVAVLHADKVLGCAGDTERDVHLRLHGLASLADLEGV